MTRAKGAAASMLLVVMDVKPGVDPDVARAALDESLHRLRTEGPALASFNAARARLMMRRARAFETSSGRAFALGVAEVQLGDAGHLTRDMQTLDGLNPQDVRAVLDRWIGPPAYQLDVLPSGRLVQTTDVDRSVAPEPSPTPPATFPVVHTARLANGLNVRIVQRSGDALVSMAVQFDAGLGADPTGRSGLGSVTLAALQEAPGLAQTAATLGADLSARTGFDSSTLFLTALPGDAEPAMALLAQAIDGPSVTGTVLDRIRSEQLARIGSEIARPDRAASRFIAPELFGAGAYGMSFSGLGNADDVAAISPADVADFRARWLRPDNATLIIVGDLAPDQAVGFAERAFRDWRAPSTPKGLKVQSETDEAVEPRVLLLDRPGAPQTVIVVGQRLPADADPTGISVLNTVLGGVGWSRVNQDLRVAKGWAYYALSRLYETRGDDVLLLTAPVQADKTLESVTALRDHLDAFAGSGPISDAERRRAVSIATLAQAGQFESTSAVLEVLLTNTELTRPDDYAAAAAARLAQLETADLQALARRALPAEGRVWFIAGDLSRFRGALEALDLGPVRVITPGDLRPPAR
jgi:zinc protease